MCNTTEDTELVICHCVITEETSVRNWSGSVTLDMIRDEPEVCRRILTHNFRTSKSRKKRTEQPAGSRDINSSMYVLAQVELGSFGPTVATLYIAQRLTAAI